MRRLTLALVFLASAGGGAFLLYSRTLGYGLDYDDYHFVRPYSQEEIAAAFRGPWDASGIELPYYRPLTVAFFAARFELLGVNSGAYHALSLVLFAAVVCLAAWFVYRFTGRVAGGFLALLFLIVHPAVPYSLVAWVTNQMHLLQALIVLLALCWWHAVRRRTIGWWMPLLVLAIAAFLVKEDGIMLLPCVLVVHVVRRRFAEQLPPIPPVFVALAVVVVGALLVLRGEALHGFTARRVPAVSLAVQNYVAGLTRVLCLAPADRPWQRVASWFVMLLPVAAACLWRRTGGRSRALLVSGACIALLFNLPFIFVTKAEQLHLVALGATCVLAASVLSLLDAIALRVGRLAVIGVAAAGAAALAVVSIDITRDFEPFGPTVLSHDEIVRGWAAVPPEIRAYLARKREPGARSHISPNPAVALERITFGTHGTETGRDGVVYTWMSGPRTDILLSPRVHTVSIPLRHAIEVFRDGVHVTIRADGQTVDQLDLNTADWRVSQTAVGLVRPSWAAGMRRVAIRIDRTWKPSHVIPGSTDGRVLGVQIGEITTRPALPITTTGARR